MKGEEGRSRSQKGSPARPPGASVLVADSQLLTAEALAAAVGAVNGLQALQVHPLTGAGAVQETLRLRPDILLLDYWMPDMEGAAACRLIRAHRPDQRVLLLSWFHGQREIEASLEAGAVGFLPRSLGLASVIDAIRRALAGEAPVFAEELREVLQKIKARVDPAAALWERLKSLTQRELAVLTLLSVSPSMKEVSRQLGIRPTTVKVHVRNILSKTGTTAYPDAIAMARACGLIRT